jgi:hypothetical protein
MDGTLVTLTTYTYATDAYVLVAKLEAEGIKVFLKNEHLVSTQNFLSNAVGGIDLQINANDLEKAKGILKKVEEEKKNSEKVPETLSKDFEKVLTYCPECESSNVYKRKGSFLSFGAKEHMCADCGHKWKQ